MLLVLLSGAGLVAFALVQLGDAVRRADATAREESRRQAERIAAELGAVLRAKSTLEAAPAICRFELRDGKVVVPPEVGWLHEPPPAFRESTLPARAAVRLQSARRGEVIDGDVAKAQRLLGEALAVEGLSPVARAHLRIEAAWLAQRSGDRKGALAQWEDVAVDPGLDDRVACSALLLARELGDAVRDREGERDRLVRACTTLPEADLRLVPEVDGREVTLRRAILAAVAGLGVVRGGESVPKVEGFDGPWLVLMSDDRSPSDARVRHGVLVWVPRLLEWLGGRTVPNSGRLLPHDPVTGWSLDAHPGVAWTDGNRIASIRVGSSRWTDASVPVDKVLAIEPQPVPRQFWADPVVLTVLLLLTAACFGTGLFLSFRALLRETAAMRARADFLTSITHELKTPLSSIRLLSEMLDEGRIDGDEKRREYYRLLAGESARLTVLIENVLDLGRMERGERAYDRRLHPIRVVVEEAVHVFAPVAERDGLALDVALGFAADGGPQARLDRGAFVQALLNVLDNARKYAPGSGRIDVRGDVANGRCRVSVRDHGPGIDAAEREAIFARFVRGQGTRDGSVAGVGLGLYLSRAILRAHGGELRCVAPEGAGAEFVFELPVEGDPKAPVQSEAPRANGRRVEECT